MSSALTAAFAASIGLSSPAHALETKQCLPMAEMNAALKTEGQRTLIIGDRVATNDAPERSSGVRFDRYVNTVTANSDGSVGYQLEGDLPKVQASTKVCVAAKLTNVKLYDINRESIPQAAFLGGGFDDVVRGNATKGVRPMMIADTDFSGRKGLPMVMFGEVADRTASIATRLPNGKPQLLVLMADTDYTSAGRARLGTQVAMREPQ